MLLDQLPKQRKIPIEGFGGAACSIRRIIVPKHLEQYIHYCASLLLVESNSLAELVAPNQKFSHQIEFEQLEVVQ